MLAVRVDVANGVIMAELAAVHCAASLAFGYSAGGPEASTKVRCCKMPPKVAVPTR